MGGKASSLKDLQTLVVPAVISLLLFLTGTYILLPAWRRYRARYAQYLPIDSLSSGTWSLRDRLTARLAAFANRREDRHLVPGAVDIDHRDEDVDDGEELGDVDDRMRRAIESHERVAGGRPDNHRRLSRE
ncbi:hypothetical protein ACRE_022350 [Hapsidospora chrysogenum ATCC 11550]|uniref:Uncharacterized protein n=1 Tax=Hapsidospora chrysogenum (strain ATCC 11550 / CBS 779.69 / DSM 880 / IAM 14645 / JCM 23072 / IMI 49137) TaxID=857340 RepID=A0A086TC82_HAPC1|nr:hypothetical protein ACRE_022350 [Hapsidospora chrysogenum ATCC 11550]